MTHGRIYTIAEVVLPAALTLRRRRAIAQLASAGLDEPRRRAELSPPR